MNYISDMLCDYKTSPKGLCKNNLRFSWKIIDIPNEKKQIKYRILICSSVEMTERFYGDIFDSGIIDSEECSFKSCLTNLDSYKEYYWRVIVISECDNIYKSEVAEFEMGILDKSLWKGKWIGTPTNEKAVFLFRHLLVISKPVVKGRIYLSTCGISELWINGVKQGNGLLEPATTDCDKTIFINTFDITAALRQGINAIGIRLMDGWVKHAKFMLQGIMWFNDGLIEEFYSDNKCWTFTLSPILSASIYSGEIYNSNYEDENWCLPADTFEKNYHHRIYNLHSTFMPLLKEECHNDIKDNIDAYYDAIELPSPKGVLKPQYVEQIRKIKELQPVSISKINDIYIVDFGQNFSGWVKIKIRGERGQVITITHSEILKLDGTLDTQYLHDADPNSILPMQTDTYICCGIEKIYEPNFTYHGFRYVCISGYIDFTITDICGVVVHTDVKEVGVFESSDPIINRIQHCTLWSEKTNLHGIPTDCPQRAERHGWLNDMTVRAESAVFNFNEKLLLSKWLGDIVDTQDMVSGAISDTAPYRRGNFPADTICGSFLMTAQLIYQHYADVSVISDYYENFKKWTDYLGRNCTNGIFTYSFYGDWASPINYCYFNSSPVSKITSGVFVSSVFYLNNVRLMIRFAKQLEKNDDMLYYSTLEKKIVNNINEKYFNQKNMNYDKGSQASNALALSFDLPAEHDRINICKNIVDDIISKDYHLTTGNLATKYIFEVLTRMGYVDLCYTLITQKTYPSFGYMLESGATTLWERWEAGTGGGMNSQNHAMYGSISAWFYKYLAGINPIMPGYKVFYIKPYIPNKLQFVNASVETVYGIISSRWEKKINYLHMSVKIPFNTYAIIHVPIKNGCGAIYLEDEIIWNNGLDIGSIRCISCEDNFVLYKLTVGIYQFVVDGFYEKDDKDIELLEGVS